MKLTKVQLGTKSHLHLIIAMLALILLGQKSFPYEWMSGTFFHTWLIITFWLGIVMALLIEAVSWFTQE